MSLEDVIAEVKENYYVGFYEISRFLVNPLCKMLNLDVCSDEVFDLKLTLARVLKHEYEIRPIIEDCERILGRRV